MATKLPPNPVGVPPGSSYWNDWYEKLRTFVDTALDSTGSGLIVRSTGPTIVNPIITGTITVNGFTGETVTIPLAKITGGGTDGQITFEAGVLRGYVSPT